MTAFLLTPESVAKIETLRAAAAANVIPEKEMRQRQASQTLGLTNYQQSMDLPLGYTLTFTHEWQPMGTCRHMSLGGPMKGRIPSKEACEMVMPHLGFVASVENCYVYPEKLADGCYAINVIERVESGSS